MRNQCLIVSLLMLLSCTACGTERSAQKEPAAETAAQTVSHTTEPEKEENAVKIELKSDDGYLVGTYSSRRFGCELDVEAYIKDGISEEYVQRCVDTVENMTDAQISELNEAAKRYALAFIELCRESMGDDFTFEEAELPVITEDTPAEDVAQYFQIGSIYPEVPEDGTELYFRLSGGCDWEIEHGFEAAYQDGKLVYLGAFEDVTPSRLDYYINREGREWNYAAG